MRIFLIFCSLLSLSLASWAQTNTYTVSFDNAVHHQANITAHFPNIKQAQVVVRMPRTSPGRYALHEFAKNVYEVNAVNGKGEALSIRREDPYSWTISGHDGTVTVSYTLFANRADGTYSQINTAHAHLNMPATFMYLESTEARPIEIEFDLPKDSQWKVATQLKKISDTRYSAPDLYYFLDSPTELSNFKERSFTVDGQTIAFVLHGPDTQADLDQYWKQVQALVLQEKAVFGSLPNFDYGRYTFLACYDPNVSGDGMEHRNSTILTTSRTLAGGGMQRNLGTVAHEFFHSWNVERIRPADLEPFDFTAANMSASLWFAEGFTSYYTNLMLRRAQIITDSTYAQRLNGTFNYVWNSPARDFFNPIEMSYQAPFVDAATSVDPVNRGNTFISYYSYGSMLGLALDLSLRQKGLDLDTYFRKVWEKHGQNEVAYTVNDLEQVLADYAGNAFAKAYFDSYIYKSGMPDYDGLFKTVGLRLERNDNTPFSGLRLTETATGLQIAATTTLHTPAYKAMLDKGDIITAIDDQELMTKAAYEQWLEGKKPGDKVLVRYTRFGETQETTLTLTSDPTYSIALDPNPSKAALEARKAWLGKK